MRKKGWFKIQIETSANTASLSLQLSECARRVFAIRIFISKIIIFFFFHFNKQVCNFSKNKFS
jgi:hypothetical protein